MAELLAIAFQYSSPENPWTEEPGGLQSMGSQRVGHNLTTNTSHLGFSGGANGKRIRLSMQEAKETRVRFLGQKDPLE